MKLFIAVSALLAAFAFTSSEAANCQLIPPLSDKTGPQYGLVFNPGAGIPGEKYASLAGKIQELFPGELWVGLIQDYLGDLPNNIEIGAALNGCTEKAGVIGLNTEKVFHGAHSLGGIVLEAYMNVHPDLSAGLIMFGTYLPDLLPSDNNEFPVPVLTAVGSLDAGVMPYVRREADESKAAEVALGTPGRYPVFIIEKVNHAQVFGASDAPESRFNDIYAEVSNEEAWTRYASAAVAFMITQNKGDFSQAEVSSRNDYFEIQQEYTDSVLVPFRELVLLEDNGESQSPWAIEGQKLMLTPQNQAETEIIDNLLEIKTELLNADDIGDAKPGLEWSGICGDPVTITTFTHPQYDVDPVDADQLSASRSLKTKLKLEDYVRETLCLDALPRADCSIVNRAAFQLALVAASNEALERFNRFGRKLSFIEDNVTPWGPGWLYDTGLKYTKISETETTLQTTSLISGPSDLVPEIANQHYCDFLTPLRALEWIYFTGVLHQEA